MSLYLQPHSARRNPNLSMRLPPTGSTPRGAKGKSRGTTSVSGDPQSWEGRAFYVQIEKCCGLGDHGMSVRYDEEKYMRQARAIKEGIESFFDEQLPVAVVDVTTPYAMEVRVMPDDCHPRQGQRVVGQNAEVAGGRTIFSKISQKRWPKLEFLISELMSFCRVPVQISLYGRELRASTADVPGNSWAAQGTVAQAVNAPNNRGVIDAATYAGQSGDVKSPLPHVSFTCTHASSGTAPPRPSVTDTEGKAEVILFPGEFAITCEVNSSYDRLTPNIISVPAHFEPLEVTVTASMKKQCALQVTDQYNKPFPRFPLKLVPLDSATGLMPLTLRTKLDGKCKSRLGRGVYVATYHAEGAYVGEGERLGNGSGNGKHVVDSQLWPIKPFQQELDVLDSDLPQFFPIKVHRTRFTVEVMLRTSFGASPARVPFSVRHDGEEPFCRALSNDIGVAVFDAPPGKYLLQLEPSDESPFVQAFQEIVVHENGTFVPLDCQVETKNVDIKICLVTPDGLPAPHCVFHLSPQFHDPGRAVELAFRSDAEGSAMCTMGLLEPYIFKVKNTGKVMEYMPQQFAFQTDRRSFTAVVARSLFTHIPEEHVVILVDTSGSMQGYIEDIKTAINTILVQQFRKSTKRFSIVSFSDKNVLFRKELVDCSAGNLEAAMRFLHDMEAGGGSGATKSLERVFAFKDMEAVYFITDGKCEVGEALLNRCRALYFSHPKRPKLHTIGINCVPRRLTWRGLESMAALTQATFRPVCLQQAEVDPVAALVALRGGGIEGRVGMNLAGPGEIGVSTDDGEAGDRYSFDEFSANFTSDDGA